MCLRFQCGKVSKRIPSFHPYFLFCFPSEWLFETHECSSGFPHSRAVGSPHERSNARPTVEQPLVKGKRGEMGGRLWCRLAFLLSTITHPISWDWLGWRRRLSLSTGERKVCWVISSFGLTWGVSNELEIGFVKCFQMMSKVGLRLAVVGAVSGESALTLSQLVWVDGQRYPSIIDNPGYPGVLPSISSLYGVGGWTKIPTHQWHPGYPGVLLSISSLYCNCTSCFVLVLF